MTMRLSVFFIFLAFASEKNKNNTANPGQRNTDDPILVKIEEDERVKIKYFGVTYHTADSRWYAYRRSKHEKKNVYNGSYEDEETAARASDTLARKLLANGEQHRGLKLNYPRYNTEVYPEEKKTSSKYIGVTYYHSKKWRAHRWSKNDNKQVSNGSSKDEETAARASDTLARKLMANGEQNHKLNFPLDNTEVYPEKIPTSKYIGVHYHTKSKTWRAHRWSKNEKTKFSNGCYKNECTAARASDTLARKLIDNGEKNHKLNFPVEEVRENKRKRSEDVDVSQTNAKIFAKFEKRKQGKIKKINLPIEQLINKN